MEVPPANVLPVARMDTPNRPHARANGYAVGNSGGRSTNSNTYTKGSDVITCDGGGDRNSYDISGGRGIGQSNIGGGGKGTAALEPEINYPYLLRSNTRYQCGACFNLGEGGRTGGIIYNTRGSITRIGRWDGGIGI